MVIFAMLLLPLLGLSDWASNHRPHGRRPVVCDLHRHGSAVKQCGDHADAHSARVDPLRRRHQPHHAVHRDDFHRYGDSSPLVSRLVAALLHWQPLRGVVDVPYRIYSGDICSWLPWARLQQACWSLIWCGRWLLSVSIRRLVVQGGCDAGPSRFTGSSSVCRSRVRCSTAPRLCSLPLDNSW